MKLYKIVSVLWEDHSSFVSQELPSKDSIIELIVPSLTIGILVMQTKRHLVVASHIERYGDRDEADYNVILRGSVIHIEEHGTIPIVELKERST